VRIHAVPLAYYQRAKLKGPCHEIFALSFSCQSPSWHKLPSYTVFLNLVLISQRYSRLLCRLLAVPYVQHSTESTKNFELNFVPSCIVWSRRKIVVTKSALCRDSVLCGITRGRYTKLWATEKGLKQPSMKKKFFCRCDFPYIMSSNAVSYEHGIS
jgi:hypothetical protein